MDARRRKRDLRIDFFRGLVLIFIFIDHVPDNVMSRLTLRNFGFSDAAEAFVLISGISAALAYSRAFDSKGFNAGADKVAHRVIKLYFWQMLILAASAVLLYGSAWIFNYPDYVANIGLQDLAKAPLAAAGDAMVLRLQPNMLNILPLYIVLLLWFPVVFWTLKRSYVLALAVSGAIYAAANIYQVNLPSTLLKEEGWLFNPFAWQLLLTIGAIAGDLLRRDAFPQSKWLLVLAMAYAGFAFLCAAPWTVIPWLQDARLISTDFAGDMDKTYLSIWRLMHIVALGYIAFSLVPRQAAWLDGGAMRWIIRCGQNALEIFCLGTLLSFTGWIVLNEAGSGFIMQLAVNAAGITVMGIAAWFLAHYRRRSADVSGSRRWQSQASSSSYSTVPSTRESTALVTHRPILSVSKR